MSLEEEIVLNQFGQGVRSVANLLDQFIQLEEAQQRKQFVDLYCQVWEFKLVDADVEQALADCSLKATDLIYAYLNLHRLTTGLKNVICIPHSANPPEGRLDKAYQLLLYLFKTDYQRRFALEKGNSTNWWYWDLSDSEISQGILTRHRELVDEIYNTPGFWSEFAVIAKRWYDDELLTQTQFQEPAPGSQTHFNFLTYDEVVTESVMLFDDKDSRAIGLLRHSLAKALSVRYRLAAEQVNRLIVDVIERHLQETYNTGLF